MFSEDRAVESEEDDDEESEGLLSARDLLVLGRCLVGPSLAVAYLRVFGLPSKASSSAASSTWAMTPRELLLEQPDIFDVCMYFLFA